MQTKQTAYFCIEELINLFRTRPQLYKGLLFKTCSNKSDISQNITSRQWQKIHKLIFKNLSVKDIIEAGVTFRTFDYIAGQEFIFSHGSVDEIIEAGVKWGNIIFFDYLRGWYIIKNRKKSMKLSELPEIWQARIRAVEKG